MASITFSLLLEIATNNKAYYTKGMPADEMIKQKGEKCASCILHLFGKEEIEVIPINVFLDDECENDEGGTHHSDWDLVAIDVLRAKIITINLGEIRYPLFDIDPWENKLYLGVLYKSFKKMIIAS